MAGASAVGVLVGSGRTGPGAGSTPLMASLTPDEIREIREYDKLLRFGDEVVSGSHPRIKPTHLLGKPAQSSHLPRSSAAATTTAPAPPQPTASRGRPVIDNFQSHGASQQSPPIKMASNLPGLGTLPAASGGARPFGFGKPEINPVLLEKSEDLIRAEMRLQRQRLERSLRAQFEQRRAANKASEQLAELDVAGIMAKALSLVDGTPAARSTDDTAANASASSDSFDDNTFYSSRHDTPESNMVSRLPNESEVEEMQEGSPYEPVLELDLDLEPVPQPEHIQTAALPTQAVTRDALSQPQHQPQQLAALAPVQPSQTAAVTVPGLSIGVDGSAAAYKPPPAPEAAGALQNGLAGRSGEPTMADTAQSSGAPDLARVNEPLLGQALAPESPLVRSHDLSPLAPQPTHVLPPAIAGQPQLATSEPSSGVQATPAQVAALRKQPSSGSSPESSPQGSRPAEKKKNKKKKRKADRLAAETAAASPYIKPEPRSPSPLTPQYARPNKRQRRSQLLQQPVEINDDEPRYEQPLPADSYQERYQPRVVRQERIVGYERAGDYHPRYGEEPILVTSPRYARVYYDDYSAPPPSRYPARPEQAEYIPREVRVVRPAPRVVEGPYDGALSYEHDARAASRMSARLPAYLDRSPSPVTYVRPPAAMPPPTIPPRRVIIDEFGREYLEPARSATVARPEVVSEPRGSYERVLPPRAMSRRPEPLEVLYAPASPAYAVPKRVVTQPEYAYRGDAGPGNLRPSHPPAEHAPSRPEPPREYITRAPSVRPPVESGRYDAYARVPVVEERPPASEDYRAASARPAEGVARYEAPVTYESRAGPDEPMPLPPREYRPQPAPLPPHPAPLRSASVHPVETAVRYEVPGGYGARAVSGRAEYQDFARDTMPPPPPPPRAYSVMPGEAPPPQAVRREYGAQTHQPAERYYGRPPPPPMREDDEVVFLDRPPPPREVYREMR